MTITGYDNTKYISYICCLALIKYEDTISFTKIFKYLNDMFNFNPFIVHSDYANSLRKVLLTQGLFKKEPIIVHCFFHFVQFIVKKMKLLKIIKKKLQKKRLK